MFAWGKDGEDPVGKKKGLCGGHYTALSKYLLNEGLKQFFFYLSEKPAVKKLPEKSILSVGELVLLTCEVTGDPEPSVTWSKNGNSSIPRAQFKNDGRILIIKDVLPGDRGVYECKASNKFGESHTSTTLIVAGKVH